MADPLFTPDGRYLMVRGRLWRAANPELPAAQRQHWVDALMTARRAVAAARRGQDDAALAQARQQVDAAKRALGERGPVWWRDGAPDLNRHMVHTGPYAAWYADRANSQANDESEGRAKADAKADANAAHEASAPD